MEKSLLFLNSSLTWIYGTVIKNGIRKYFQIIVNLKAKDQLIKFLVENYYVIDINYKNLFTKK